MKSFFNNSEWLGRYSLKPLSHIMSNWELTWNPECECYQSEDNSYADSLNKLIDEISATPPPTQYHDNEDCLAHYVVSNLKWKINKVGKRWVGADYQSILEQGGFHDINESNLIKALSGRIHAAIKFGQTHFDEMEESHMKMVAAVISIILYHRTPLDA